MRWLFYGIFECFTSLEDRLPGGLDLDFFPGLGIAPGTGGALAHREGAESHEGYAVTLFQRFGYGRHYPIDSPCSRRLGKIRRSRHGFHQFRLVHVSHSHQFGRRPLCRGRAAGPNPVVPAKGRDFIPMAANPCQGIPDQMTTPAPLRGSPRRHKRKERTWCALFPTALLAPRAQ